MQKLKATFYHKVTLMPKEADFYFSHFLPQKRTTEQVLGKDMKTYQA